MPALRRPKGAHDIYEVPRRKEDLPQTFPPNRRCLDCSATLSIYNPHDRCWCHSASEPEEDLASLMQAA